MKDFNEYISEWFEEFVNNAHPVVLDGLLEAFGFTYEQVEEAETTISDYLIAEADSDLVYETLFGFSAEFKDVNIPDAQDFVKEMLMQAVGGLFKDKYGDDISFVKCFVEDMAYRITNYDKVSSFFSDLRHGCSSGMIGMLVYNDDCKTIYIEHIDDMEDFREEFEGELGARMQKEDCIRHYTFMCWLCYEELGHSIASNLFPEEF